MSRVAALAARAGCTEGQLYTMTIGLLLASVLAAGGIPAVLEDRPLAAPAPLALDQADAGTAPPGATPTQSPVPPPAQLPSRTPGGSFGPAPAEQSAGGTVDGTSVPGAAPAPPAAAPGTITTFARLAELGPPTGLAVAAAGGAVHVTTGGGGRPSRLASFDRTGSRTADVEVDGPAAAAAFDASTGQVIVLAADARVIAVDPGTGSSTVLTRIPDVPSCLVSLGAIVCQNGIVDRPPVPVAAAFDRDGALLVTDPAQDTIWRLPVGGSTPEVWLQSPSFAAGDGPYGIAVVPDGVLVTVGTTVDPAAVGRGALYRVTDRELAVAHAFDPNEVPGAVAAGRSGTAYVALRNRGTVVSITVGGTVGAVPIDGPAGLALVDRALLVAGGRGSDDPSHWIVLAISVEDGPGA